MFFNQYTKRYFKSSSCRPSQAEIPIRYLNRFETVNGTTGVPVPVIVYGSTL